MPHDSEATGPDGINPLTVEVTRGGIVESRHRGAAAIVDARGHIQAAWGDIQRPVFPRSAIKAIQALPLVETGAADAFGFGARELAIACASHNGEALHVETVTGMLTAVGLDESALECGGHWPYSEADAHALAVQGRAPDQRHNNCSGKHAGMLALARHLGVETKGYTDQRHPVQQRVMGTMEMLTGLDLGRAAVGIDGCSVPTWAIPLENLAFAFARLCTGEDLPDDRAEAARRLIAACFREPFMVAGTDRFCTDFMTATAPRVFVKTGAEGVFCAAVPEYGLGVALKCDDGAGRAAEVMLVNILRTVGVLDDVPDETVRRFIEIGIENRRGTAVGTIRPAHGWLAF
ncbi:asparaginase [Marivibrio halodurans]|uniref:Asparaginase n=1 Tax=Marivibrio halodurans TaxID=2039722 RepID=A0A8J7V2A4_9PROT|nr:asparaginase [Marivibrio halodurans]MBP5858631.1 asparaginase [Marivibrio halodurans]